MSPYMDPTAMAQQAILARPMRPSFTGQPLLSRAVPVSSQSYNGLAYPSMANRNLAVPTYVSRYASGGGSGGSDVGSSNTTVGGMDTYGSNNSLSNGLVGALMGNLSQPSLSIPVDNMGTYANQPAFNFGSSMSGVGNPAEEAAAEAAAANNVAAGLAAAQEAADIAAANQSNSFSGSFGSEAGPAAGLSNEAGSTNATAAADNSGNTSSESGGGKIVCTAMNQQYGFGSFRNAIWLKYAENNLTKAHEAGYHAIFLPLVDFAFKQGDGKLNMLTRKFLENCARHRSLDLRAEMRGTKRDTIGMIYRSVLEPLCYAVGKFKGY